MAKQEMVCIPKKEYEKLKTEATVEKELLKEMVESLEQIKEGKFKIWE